MIDVLESAPLNSIQDLGRSGYRNVGVGASGAMDRMALVLGNWMVGNPSGHAGVEITLAPLRLRFKRDTLFAITGADFGATLDGAAVAPWTAFKAFAGQRLVFHAPPASGARAYLCVQGGLHADRVLGSYSTDLKSGFGGVGGRSLKKRDRLYPAPGEYSETKLKAGQGFGITAPTYAGDIGFAGMGRKSTVTVRILVAAQWDWLNAETQELFLETDWRVTPESNRMGYRLAGPNVPTNDRRVELPSHGILPGVVQLPPSEQPIVQLSDGNTCGGYPKLGVVIGPDLRLLGQLPLGAFVRFERIEREQALAAVREENFLLDAYASAIAASRSAASIAG